MPDLSLKARLEAVKRSRTFSDLDSHHNRDIDKCIATLESWAKDPKTVEMCAARVKAIFDLSTAPPESGFTPEDMAQAVLSAIVGGRGER